jgi:hypothetical protein
MFFISLFSNINNNFIYYELEDKEMMISYNINFGGDWTNLRNIEGIDSLCLNMRLEKQNEAVSPYFKKYNIEYDASNRPYLENFNSLNFFTLKSLTDNTSDLSVDTIVFNSANTLIKKYNNKHFSLNNKERHNLKLNINADNTSVVNLKIDGIINSMNDTIVSNKFNYNVNVEPIKYNRKDPKNSLNIVTMVDGYREDQMDLYKKLVEQSLVESFNRTNSISGKKGDFFRSNVFRYCDNTLDIINVFRFDTVSIGNNYPSETILQTALFAGTTRPNFLRIQKILQTANYSKLSPYKLSENNIDAIVIFLNKGVTHLYVTSNREAVCDFLFPYSRERNKQPINFVIMKAIPELISDGWDLDSDFKNIMSLILPHELGHGIAELDDEYTQNNNFIIESVLEYFYSREYIQKVSRNLDIDSRIDREVVKWKSFFDMGYDKVKSDFLKIDIKQGGGYMADSYIYRPSEDGMMRNHRKYLNFNPVGAYHMMASIMTRIGEVPYDLNFAKNDDLSNGIEWETYPYSKFLSDMPPDSIYFEDLSMSK